MNNQTELRNIREMFNKVQNDKKLTITGVYIEGFASPEGPLKLNEQLSKSRAEALKKYLSVHEQIPANLYNVSFGGENWEGLVKALEASNIKEKTEFLNIIRNTSDIAHRKEEIKRVGGGAPYRTMLKELPHRLYDCQFQSRRRKRDHQDTAPISQFERDVSGGQQLSQRWRRLYQGFRHRCTYVS